MIKFDTEEKCMMIAGSGIEIVAEMTALITRAFFKMNGNDGNRTRSMIKMYARMLTDLADKDDLIANLEKDDEASATIDLSHLMNKRE